MKGNKGIFITFEGCEGAGKSTQARLLKEYLSDAGFDVVVTREPGGTAISEKIRNIILDKDNSGMDMMTEALLYAASRAQHVAEVIGPALGAGKIVICDRFSDSTVAYQAYARGVGLRLIETLNGICEKSCSPDYTFFLDIPPEEGFLRKGGADKTDRLESEAAAFHRKVYEGYLELAKRNRKRIIVIDGKGGPEAVHGLVTAELKKRVRFP